jgi:hypothetical protein
MAVLTTQYQVLLEVQVVVQELLVQLKDHLVVQPHSQYPLLVVLDSVVEAFQQEADKTVTLKAVVVEEQVDQEMMEIPETGLTVVQEELQIFLVEYFISLEVAEVEDTFPTMLEIAWAEAVVA